MGHTVELPFGLLRKSSRAHFKDVAARAQKRSYRADIDDDSLVSVDFEDVPAVEYEEFTKLALASGDSRLVRAIKAISEAREGNFYNTVPNFDAFMPMLAELLRKSAKRGWLFVEGSDGYMYPYLSLRLTRHDPVRKEDGPPRVTLKALAYGRGDTKGRAKAEQSFTFEPSDVTRKTLAKILSGYGVFIENDELLSVFDEQSDYFHEHVRKGFSLQFRHHGSTMGSQYWHQQDPLSGGQKVIHDMPVGEETPKPVLVYSDVLREDFEIPAHPVLRVFDLGSHSFHWTHASNLTAYVYDKSLRDKLVLPKSHRDLLDVLTHDIDVLVSDIVEGKSAGNIIICKGIPGVGKTLTAEVYSELIEKPMYSIHSGSLGTSARSIEANLKVIFDRQKRWGCVLLLDEADVFVVERGNNIEQNAIVAEFLRVLEYYDGLLFMTTNRPDSIDEAIVSRAAAIIGYEVPGSDDCRKIWEVLMANYGVEKRAGLIHDLLALFPRIAPRDIKMLIRLAIRMSNFHEEPLSADLFRRCAMFRNVEIADVIMPDTENGEHLI